MQKLILLFVMLAAIGSVSAQNPIAKGQSQFNAGAGFSSWGVPVYVGLDFGVNRNVTLGGEWPYK